MEEVKFGCTYCGAPIEVYPPDPELTRISVNVQESSEKGYPTTYYCKVCGRGNIRYWYRAVKSDSAMRAARVAKD